jgi:Ca2+/Na+ antiporter
MDAGGEGAMIGILRLVVFGFIALSVVYLLVTLYARSVRKEELEKEFDAGGIEGSREAFIAAGLAEYKNSLRRKLLLLVYVVPMCVVALTIYLVNYQ